MTKETLYIKARFDNTMSEAQAPRPASRLNEVKAMCEGDIPDIRDKHVVEGLDVGFPKQSKCTVPSGQRTAASSARWDTKPAQGAPVIAACRLGRDTMSVSNTGGRIESSVVIERADAARLLARNSPSAACCILQDRTGQAFRARQRSGPALSYGRRLRRAEG